MYTTKAKIQDYIQFTIDDSLDTFITDCIDMARAWIDHYCNVPSFEGTSGYRYFDGNRRSELITDNFTTMSEVAIMDSDGDVDDSTTDRNDWRTYPQAIKPKTSIWLNPAGDFRADFPKGHQNIRVLATWGASTTIPKAVEMVATILVAEILRDFNPELSLITSENIGDYSISYADIEKRADRLGVKKLLDPYKRLWV